MNFCMKTIKKILTQVSNLINFQDEMAHLFSLQNEVLESKGVNFNEKQ